MLDGSGTARPTAYRRAGRLWDIDTGHDLMITERVAVAVADILGEIAAS